MKILLIQKSTNYEIHGDKLKASVVKGLVSNEELAKLVGEHDAHHKSLDSVNSVLKNHSIVPEVVTRKEKWNKSNYDLVITVGGDGTLLSAAQSLTNGGTILGIRSTNVSIGYLCAVGIGRIEDAVEKSLAKKMPVVTLQRLSARIQRAESEECSTSVPIINDFLFSHCNPACTTRYQIHLGDKSEEHKSSGVWISTSAGSTAGIYAAGGHKLKIDDGKFQYRVRELYRSKEEKHQLAGEFFDPDKILFQIRNRSDHAQLAADGRHTVEKLKFGDTVSIVRAKPIDIIRV